MLWVEGVELDVMTMGWSMTGNQLDQAVLPILDLRLDGGSLGQVRASVAAHATQAGLSPRRADDLVIAVHELAANVVRHGSGYGRVRIWQHRQALHCQVTDEGPATASTAGTESAPETGPDAGSRSGAAAPDEAPPWRVKPGHGLWLVRQLADRTRLHPGPRGTAVTISFALGAAADEAARDETGRDETA